MSTTPFSSDFDVSAHDGRMWIKPSWGPRTSEVPLDLKGVNFFNSVEGLGTVLKQIPTLGAQPYSYHGRRLL